VQQLGLEHPDTTASLNKLALLYQALGRYNEAEPLQRRTLAIREKVLGPDHLSTAISLNNLAKLYRVQGRYGEAETLFHRSLAIYGRVLGSDHPDTAARLYNLALLYFAMAKVPAAEPLLLRPDGTIRAIGLGQAAPIPTARHKRAPEVGGGEPAGAGAAGGLVSTPGYLWRAQTRRRGSCTSPPMDSLWWIRPRRGDAKAGATAASSPARQDPLQRSGLVFAGANRSAANRADDGYLTTATSAASWSAITASSRPAKAVPMPC